LVLVVQLVQQHLELMALIRFSHLSLQLAVAAAVLTKTAQDKMVVQAVEQVQELALLVRLLHQVKETTAAQALHQSILQTWVAAAVVHPQSVAMESYLQLQAVQVETEQQTLIQVHQ
jgi:hypothetical protein